MSKIWTADSIRAAMQERGSHWWDVATMRCFGTRVASAVWTSADGSAAWFVTCDKRWNETYGYTVRRFDVATADLSTIGDLAGFARLSDAIAEIEVEETIGKDGSDLTYREPAAEFQRIGNQTGELRMSRELARSLIRTAKRLERLAVLECNGPPGGDWNDDWQSSIDKRIAASTARASKLAAEAGAVGIVTGGDPRGAALKLVCRNGYTNDIGREGLIVPTGEGA